MPGPTTEVLSSDMKDLRADIQRVEATMHGEVASVRADIAAFRETFAAFRGEARVIFRLIAGIGGALLVTTILGLVSGVWWASGLTAEVKNLSARVGQLEPAKRP